MRDILEVLEDWASTDQGIALATVVSTWGSAPRTVGSKMAVRADGAMVGSVSGGCVEGAVAESALQIINGAPAQLLQFGVSDDTAWEVGLACGGSIEVFVQSLDREFFKAVAGHIREDKTVGSISCIEANDVAVGAQVLVDADGAPIAGDLDLMDEEIQAVVRDRLAKGESGRFDLNLSKPKSCRYFIDVIPAPAKLILVGGVHISIALAGMAKALGYKTFVVDPRRLFASDERFPAVDQLIQSWPGEAYEQIELDHETAVAVLTHDPKIDDPAIIGALESPAFYVGVLGSRNTHEKRIKRLKDSGVGDQQLTRLHAPIGLYIGAQSPEEIALSIMAEITAARRGVSTVA